MASRRIGADDYDDVGVHNAVEGLRTGRGAERRPQPVTGGRVADAGATIDIVRADAAFEAEATRAHLDVVVRGIHDTPADLRITLTSPDGLEIVLANGDLDVPAAPDEFSVRFSDDDCDGCDDVAGTIAPLDSLCDLDEEPVATIGHSILIYRIP